jgi:hypothetical protein
MFLAVFIYLFIFWFTKWPFNTATVAKTFKKHDISMCYGKFTFLASVVCKMKFWELLNWPFFFQLKLLVTRQLYKLIDLETEEIVLPNFLLRFANKLKNYVSGILVRCFWVQEIWSSCSVFVSTYRLIWEFIFPSTSYLTKHNHIQLDVKFQTL